MGSHTFRPTGLTGKEEPRLRAALSSIDDTPCQERVITPHHRSEERIRAHVAVCVLSYFLQRLVELRTKQSWPRVRDELQQLAAVTWSDGSASVVQSSEPSAEATRLLAALGVAPPPRLLAVSAASA